jgi:hypothetical protein
MLSKLPFGDGRSDKGNCTAGYRESHGYRGLPKGSVRMGYQGNQQLEFEAATTRIPVSLQRSAALKTLPDGIKSTCPSGTECSASLSP